MGKTERNGDESTVLVVDDEAETVDLYAAFLADEYTVLTACSGTEALELVDSSVDVVLLDRRMPEMSGDDVLSEIRSRGLDCRVVMITAVDPDMDVLDMPFDDYLTKPLSGDLIRDVVDRMLVRNRCDDAIRRIVGLASKMATIESKMTIAEMEGSDVYAALEAEFDELRTDFSVGDPETDPYVEFTDEKIRSLLD